MSVLRERMARQLLTGVPRSTPVEVVRHLGAVQAQDYAGAKWAVGMRTKSATDADVEDAVNRGEILRTHVLRPTWHFVLPEDIRWMLALTGPRIAQAMSSYNRKLGLTAAAFKRSNALIERALRDGAHVTRDELRTVLRQGKAWPAEGPQLAHMMMQAEIYGIICSGARRGKHATYALLDLRAAPSAPIDRDEALDRLARRYFIARGPASAHDFAWWSGLTIGDARRAIDVAGDALMPIRVDDAKMWTMEPRPTAPPPGHVAHLLPNYDEYFIGFKDRSSIGGRVGTKLVTGGNALINHILAIGGAIVGGWKRVQAAGETVIDLALLVPLKAEERAALEKARARLERFLGNPVTVRLRR